MNACTRGGFNLRRNGLYTVRTCIDVVVEVNDTADGALRCWASIGVGVRIGIGVSVCVCVSIGVCIS